MFTKEVIFCIVISVLCIWLYIKFKNERKKKEEVARINTKLASDNTNLVSNNTKLVADNALLEAEQLKFQLQPHTLNNILANLKVIAEKLNRGMDSLSETLDYILYKGNNHLVTVEDEMNFIKKYLALNDLFISEIDAIKVNETQINKNSPFYNEQCIPHLITAYFIENAFKHGDVNHHDFLNIQLRLTNTFFEMTVINRIKQKPSNTKKGGLGLNNMRKRLELLLSNRYEIRNSCNEQEYHSSLIIRF